MTREWFREFWRYRELFYFLIWRDVKVRYKQTALGAAWAVIQPFFTMIVFTLFFGKLARIPSDGIPYPIFFYSALLPWVYFSEALRFSGNSLVTNANLITKVYFPRAAIPASSALGGLVDFGIASVLLLGMMAYYHIGPSWELLLWPVLVVPLVLLALGVGMILAALNVKYRDVKHAIPFIIQLWLFVTPIIYPTSLVPDRFRVWLALNPLSGLIEAFRASLLPDRPLDWPLVGMSVAVALLVFALGGLYFKRAEQTFADVV